MLSQQLPASVIGSPWAEQLLGVIRTQDAQTQLSTTCVLASQFKDHVHIQLCPRFALPNILHVCCWNNMIMPRSSTRDLSPHPPAMGRVPCPSGPRLHPRDHLLHLHPSQKSLKNWFCNKGPSAPPQGDRCVCRLFQEQVRGLRHQSLLLGVSSKNPC